VVISTALRDAVRLNLSYLQSTDRADWAQLLEQDLSALGGLLVAAPRAGRLIEKRAGSELRRIRLHRTPFDVWYVIPTKASAKPIVLLRLFHVRQRARTPRGW
jgi:hypothetical protein